MSETVDGPPTTSLAANHTSSPSQLPANPFSSTSRAHDNATADAIFHPEYPAPNDSDSLSASA